MELCGITLFWGNFSLSTTVLWTIFSRSTTLLWTNLFEPENAQTRRKHEKKTKKTRKKHAILRTFRLPKEKISGLNWTTETKGSKWRFEIKGSKRAFGLVENQPHHFVPRWREVTNFIAGCDEVALKNATSYFFGKPIDKIRSVWYTLIKEVKVLL